MKERTAEEVAAAKARFEAAVAFGKEHGLVCTGNPIEGPCPDQAVAVVMSVLHGRPGAMQCQRCEAITGQVIMYMGHGSYQVHLLMKEYPADQLKAVTQKWADRVKAQGMQIPKGRYWTAKKEKDGRAALLEQIAELKES